MTKLVLSARSIWTGLVKSLAVRPAYAAPIHFNCGAITPVLATVFTKPITRCLGPQQVTLNATARLNRHDTGNFAEERCAQATDSISVIRALAIWVHGGADAARRLCAKAMYGDSCGLPILICRT